MSTYQQAEMATVRGVCQRFNEQLKLGLFAPGVPPSLSDIGVEFKTLSQFIGNAQSLKGCTETETIALKAYKLFLMQSLEEHLRKNPLANESSEDRALLSPDYGTWAFYATLFSLDLIPMVWSTYIGIIDVLQFIPALPEIVASSISMSACVAAVVLYYASNSPFLKRGLGLVDKAQVNHEMAAYHDQHLTLERIKALMLDEDSLSAEDYRQCAHLVKTFEEDLAPCREYKLYYLDNLLQANPTHYDDKTILLIKDKFYFIENHHYRSGSDGTALGVAAKLSPQEKTLLRRERRKENGFVVENQQTVGLLNKIRDQFSLQEGLKVPRFQERWRNTAMRWLLSSFSLVMNFGSSYAFSLFLLDNTLSTAALMGTPSGLALMGVLMIGQIALQWLVRNDALFELLNPDARSYMRFRHELNNSEPKGYRIDRILKNKLTAEAQAESKREERVHWKNLSNNLGLITTKHASQNRGSTFFNNPRPLLMKSDTVVITIDPDETDATLSATQSLQ